MSDSPSLTNPSDLLRRSIRNASWSIADYLVLPILSLLATPLLVRNLGNEEFGIWILSNSLLGLTGVFTFGLADATVRFVSKYRSLADEDGVVRVVRSSLFLYLLLGAAVAAIGVVLSPPLATSVFSIDPAHQESATRSLRLVSIGICLKSVDNVLLAIFHGYERYDLAAKLTMPWNILVIIVCAGLSIAGYSTSHLLFAIVLLVFLSAVTKAFVAKATLCRRLMFVPLIHKESFREVFGYGIFSWIQGVMGTLLAQFDKLIIATSIGASGMAYYGVALQLAQQVHVVLAKATGFIFPLASASREDGDLSTLRKVYFGSSTFVNIAAVTVAVPLFIFAPDILKAWIGEHYAEHASNTLRILSFALALVASSVVPYYYLNGTGFVRLNTYLGIASGTIVATSALSLVPSLGIIGAAIARLASFPIQVASRLIIHSRILRDKRWYASVLVFVPVIVPFGLSQLALSFVPHGVNLYSLVGLILLSALFSGLIAFFLTRILRIEQLESQS